MTIFQAVILGIVQGLGEFLPISSSAHLVIVPWLMNFPDPGLTIDVSLHLGTLIALLAYFFNDWVELIKCFFTSLKKGTRFAEYNFEEKLIWILIFASVPGAIAGALLEKKAETVFRSPLLIAGMMAIMGLVLWLADRFSKKGKSLQDVTFLDGMLVGISQALAIIPGVSRSGVTITTGLFRNFDRATAARFSFLLSTPIVFGAVVFKFKEFIHSHLDLPALTGIAVSAVVGYLAIKYMLSFLQRYSYTVFVVYRWLFAVVVVAVWFSRK